MVQCGTWDWCIVGLVRTVYANIIGYLFIGDNINVAQYLRDTQVTIHIMITDGMLHISDQIRPLIVTNNLGVGQTS